jgi:nucleotide-binding universal stress UspA family protein
MIVVGVDGSPASQDALRWAVDEARLRSSSVLAVHVWQAPAIPADIAPVPMHVPAFDVTGLHPRIEEAARKTVERIVHDVVGDAADVDVRPTVVQGSPATVLIDAAREAELLVIGSRGHGGFAGLLLGSVSHQVAQHATCPVVILRHVDDERRD